MTPRASIVMTLWGKRAVTERCLASLEHALGPALGTEFELILVDNASPDDTSELLDRWEDRATVLRQPTNRNYGGGNNDGVAVARGEVLILLNNDTEVPPGTLEALVEEAGDPEVVAAGCRLLYPDGSIQHAGMAFKAEAQGVAVPFHLFRHEAGDLPAAGSVLHLDCVTGAALAMRRELYLRLGGFDERYVNGWEDVDLLLRARVETGGRIVYRGDVAAVHHEGLTRGTRGVDDTANRQVFYGRWRDMLDEDTSTIAAAFGARFSPFGTVIGHPGDHPAGSLLTIGAALLGLGPESDEARALFDAAERAGLEPAARELPLPWVTPALPDVEFARLHAAHQRARHPHALELSVPVGRWQPLPDGPRAVLRLGRVAAGAIDPAAQVWVPTRRLAGDLTAAGHPAARTAVLAPAVSAPLGAGGGGLLAILPVHDAALSDRLVEALAAVEGVSLRVLPTVGGPATEALVAERLPGAELVAAISTEAELAALAGSADAVVAIDADDPYARRALLAAAAGAAPVADTAGPAGEILGDRLHAADGSDASAVAAAIRSALADDASREERAAAVATVCAPDVVAGRMSQLVEALLAQRSGPPFGLSLLSP